MLHVGLHGLMAVLMSATPYSGTPPSVGQQIAEPHIELWISGDVLRRGDRAHVWFQTDADAYVTVLRIDTDGRVHRPTTPETPDESMLHAVANAYRTLMAGFTTVQSLGSPIDLPLRDAIARGDIPGPRVLTSLRPLTDSPGDADAIRAAIRQLKADGAAVIKMFASRVSSPKA